MSIINERCFDEKTLSSYLDERLSEAERKKIEGHIADCNACLDMLLVAYESHGRGKKCPMALKQRIKNNIGVAERSSASDAGAKLAKARFAIPKKKRLFLKWLFSAIFFFALSFAFRHYFLQFLAISVVLGFKWVMEGEGAKRVIMIFRGIQEKEKKVERKS
ncbi:MAG: anti-sigma factor, partial [Candidatus Omnitrophota bacterium]|nr:anti-sigma factor [Candidatus Omnitrophota bacterium]